MCETIYSNDLLKYIGIVNVFAENNQGEFLRSSEFHFLFISAVCSIIPLPSLQEILMCHGKNSTVLIGDDGQTVVSLCSSSVEPRLRK